MKRWIVLVALLLSACGGGDSEDPKPGTWLVPRWASENHRGGIMMLGDSITAGWPQQYLPEGAINRGVPGDKTTDVLARFWLVVKEEPDELYLMIGVNDLCAFGEGWDRPTQHVVENIEKMILQLPSSTKIHVESILPTDRIPLTTIVETNQQIQKMLVNYPSVEYINLYPLFLNDYGQILYLYDGIHPGDSGYLVMKAVLFPEVTQ